MAHDPNSRRNQMYYRLNSQLTQMDNAQLSSLLDNSQLLTSWGRNQTVNIEGSRIFVKRIPITDIELGNMFSTANLYDLPLYYNYGVGSVGSGIFRELVTHIKTTNWVLSGETHAFPLLYHYRVLSLSGDREDLDIEKHDEYVTYWGGSENIGRYMIDRANANAELVLFLEHIPEVLATRLQDHPDQVDRILTDLGMIVDFLRQKGITHFDLHSWNVLTDGERLYLTDFGLSLDRSFALRQDEKVFFDANTHYDYGRLLADLMIHIYIKYDALSEDKQCQFCEIYGVLEEDNSWHRVIPVLFENVEAIAAGKLIDIHEALQDCVDRYRSIIALMIDFMSKMGSGPQKEIPFPDAELKRRLIETGYISIKNRSGELHDANIN